MFCENCGAQLPEGTLFCSACGQTTGDAAGQPVSATVEATAEQAQNVTEQAQQIPAAVSEADAYREEVKSTYKNKVSHTILSVLLSILIVVMGFCATMIFIVRTHTGEDAVDAVVKAVDIPNLKVDIYAEEGKHNRTLTEFCLDYAPERMKYYLGEEEIEEVLKQKFVSKFLTNKINDYVEDVFYNTGDGIVEPKEIEKLLNDNSDTIEEAIWYYLDEEDVADIVDHLDRDGVFDKTDLSDYREDHPQTFALVKNLLSYWMLAVLCVFAVLFTICIFLLQRRKIRGCQYTGINLMITGVLVLASAIALGVYINDLDKNIIFGRKVWTTLLTPMKNAGLQLGGITVATGVVVFILYLVVKKIQISIAAKKMRKR